MTDIKLGVEERVGHGAQTWVDSLTGEKEIIYFIKTITRYLVKVLEDVGGVNNCSGGVRVERPGEGREER